MTDQTPRTALSALTGTLRLTLAGLWAERLVRAFWPVWSLLIGTLALLAFGVQDMLSLGAVWTALAMVLVGMGWALIAGLRAFRRPTRAEALARLDATLPGRPIAALQDSQAIGAGDPASIAVWQAHQARMAARAATARPVRPDLRLARRDPFALRYIALTALVMALTFGSLWRAVSIAGMAPGGDDALADGPTWEGWAEPPAYTGKPTVYLNDVTDPTLALPIGSRIQIRLYGEAGALTIAETISEMPLAPPATEGAEAPPELVRDIPLTRSGSVTIAGDNGRSWDITAIPDASPSILSDAAMTREADGRMQLPFSAKDDYGVTGGQAVIALDLGAIDRRYGLAADPEARDAVALDLPLPISGNRAEFSEILVDDLSKHPFANLPVTITLSAMDAAGQTGAAAPLKTTLPGRRFFDPVAAALIEARRDILWARANVDRTVQVLKAVTHRPEGLFRNQTAYLQLRVLIRRLDLQSASLTVEDRDELAESLWEIALLVEEGDLASALEALRRAQDRLDEAIRNGADPDEIENLMQEMREALNDYMQELAEEAQRNPDSQQQAENLEGQMVPADQLQEMMDQLQQLMEEGRMAEAAELMEMMRQLMENMQVVEGQGGEGQRSPGQQAMRDLAETLREQEGLSDDSFRELQEGQQGQGQPGDGQPGQPGEGQGQGGEGLAQRQQDLRDRLNGLGDESLPGQGSESGEAGRRQLDRAGRAMEEAERALRDGDLPGALDRQAEAMEALREGMRDLGEALAEDQQQQQDGTAQGEQFGNADPNSERDPLGRAPGEAGRIGSDRNMLQGEDVYRRAQDLLDEIRRRSGDQARPDTERDYLRRLLDQF